MSNEASTVQTFTGGFTVEDEVLSLDSGLCLARYMLSKIEGETDHVLVERLSAQFVNRFAGRLLATACHLGAMLEEVGCLPGPAEWGCYKLPLDKGIHFSRAEARKEIEMRRRPAS